MKLVLDIKDESKTRILVQFLKELPFVEVEQKTLKKKNATGLRNLCGIWKDRDITLTDLRKKAWDRSQ